MLLVLLLLLLQAGICPEICGCGDGLDARIDGGVSVSVVVNVGIRDSDTRYTDPGDLGDPGAFHVDVGFGFKVRFRFGLQSTFTSAVHDRGLGRGSLE